MEKVRNAVFADTDDRTAVEIGIGVFADALGDVGQTNALIENAPVVEVVVTDKDMAYHTRLANQIKNTVLFAIVADALMHDTEGVQCLWVIR